MTDTLASGVPQPVLVEVWRGPVLECVHRGTAVVCGPDGSIEAAWGDPDRVVLPRSAAKMMQALPLVESGAAEAAGLTDRHLALASASHWGTEVHTGLVRDWLSGLGLGEGDLRCGPMAPTDPETRHALRMDGIAIDQCHHNCSGKHSGFLTATKHLGGGSEYIDPDHPVQRAVRAALSEMADEEITDHATDGCSAPNFAVSLRGLATAFARVATAERTLSGARQAAAIRLRTATATHPDLVSGNGSATTRLMRDMTGVSVKSGAEGVYIAALPGPGLGIALKIDDGSDRGSNGAMAAILARLGALSTDAPTYRDFADAPLLNSRRTDCGRIRAVL